VSGKPSQAKPSQNKGKTAALSTYANLNEYKQKSPFQGYPLVFTSSQNCCDEAPLLFHLKSSIILHQYSGGLFHKAAPL